MFNYGTHVEFLGGSVGAGDAELDGREHTAQRLHVEEHRGIGGEPRGATLVHSHHHRVQRRPVLVLRPNRLARNKLTEPERHSLAYNEPTINAYEEKYRTQRKTTV